MKKLVIGALLAILVITPGGFTPANVEAAVIDSTRGKIVLQVEDNGEAWYVNPVNDQRYFLGRPADAFSIMRELALGIKHSELEKYLNSSFPSKLSGRIMLDVELNGEAYYVYPNDLKGYYLGRPADAFRVMRELGLGITNANLEQIVANTDLSNVSDSSALVNFDSAEDFKNYLASVDEVYDNNFFPVDVLVQPEFSEGIPISDGAEFSSPVAAPEAKQSADRVSETNVQVKGIDEPDYLKTNGEELFYSPQQYNYFFDMPVAGEFAPDFEPATIKAVNAFPPADMKLDSEIEKNGRMILTDDSLVVFQNNSINGVNVGDPTAPRDTWTIELENNSSIVASRLYNNELYIVTNTYINRDLPCPLIPISVNNTEMIVPCREILHPRRLQPLSNVYTVWRINPHSGQIQAKNAITGASGSSVVYMSTNNLYVTQYQPGDFVNFTTKFLLQNKDLFPQYLNDFFVEVDGFDIPSWDKKQRILVAIRGYLATLDPDEEVRIQNELTNRYDTYALAEIRNYEATNITKFSLNSLAVEATGTVPGRVLNQFSLGEENGHLFVATTIGENRFFTSRVESTNDLYSLNSRLGKVDSIKDLGIGERIYAVRILAGKAYIVTFRQIDPFYVLDISNPADLELQGELKIPGYSAYLHPISDTKILGVGEEDFNVKLSLFDVSDPYSPQEISKYQLDEYHSDVLNDHRAFLQDDKHQIVFIPGSKASYIFSYANDKLELVRAVTDVRARRALFLDDYLYLVGDDGIVVLDENTWETVSEFSFN